MLEQTAHKKEICSVRLDVGIGKNDSFRSGPGSYISFSWSLMCGSFTGPPESKSRSGPDRLLLGGLDPLVCHPAATCVVPVGQGSQRLAFAKSHTKGGLNDV